MIRIAQSQTPEAWHDLEINFGADIEPAAMRVKYRLLSKSALAEWSGRRLSLAKAVRANDESTTFDLLLEELSPEQLARADALLRAHILDWDLVDADAEKDARLPVNERTLTAILDQMRFWRPLLQGLIDASSGMAARKNA